MITADPLCKSGQPVGQRKRFQHRDLFAMALQHIPARLRHPKPRHVNDPCARHADKSPPYTGML